MGIGPSYKYRRCCTNSEPEAVAPNPSPSRWTLIRKEQHKNAYVLYVRYHDCTNFEGQKIMVYKGQYVHQEMLDPHFSIEEGSPFARFAPTKEGWDWACDLAHAL